MSTIQERLGLELRRLREAAGWTQEELAARAGKHWTYIGAIERGTRNITVAVLADLADALGVEPRDLLPPKDRRRR